MDAYTPTQVPKLISEAWAIRIVLLTTLSASTLAAQKLPAPTGSFAVGMTRQTWVDSARGDSLGGRPARPRAIGIDVWYPASSSVSSSPYIDPGSATWMARNGSEDERRRIPAAVGVATHSGLDARAHPGEAWPVILFSHGTGMFPAFYTSQLEELASHGYVVVALTHGGVAPVLLSARDTIIMGEVPSAPAAMNAGIARNARGITQDLLFVARELAAGRRPGPLAEARLKTDRLGLVGHSTAGVAALSLCHAGSPFVACANEDGMLAGLPVLTGGLARPDGAVLFMTKGMPVTPPPNFRDASGAPVAAGTWPSIRARMQSRVDSALRSYSGRAAEITYAGAQHRSFSDFALLPERSGGASGGADLVAALRRTLVTFFGRELRGDSSLSLANLAAIPGVTVRAP